MAQKAYDQYVGGMTDGCIMLAHSQGGLFTVNAALAHPENVKAVVLVESSSSIDVDKTDVSAFKDIPFLFIWGDFLGEEYCTPDYRWIGDFAYQGTMRKLHERILELGGDSTWIHLPEIGIRGNTHAMMQEDKPPDCRHGMRLAEVPREIIIPTLAFSPQKRSSTRNAPGATTLYSQKDRNSGKELNNGYSYFYSLPQRRAANVSYHGRGFSGPADKAAERRRRQHDE